MKTNKTRPQADEREETAKRKEDKTRSGASKQRPDHHPGDREDSLPCHIDPQKPPGTAR